MSRLADYSGPRGEYHPHASSGGTHQKFAALISAKRKSLDALLGRALGHLGNGHLPQADAAIKELGEHWKVLRHQVSEAVAHAHSQGAR
jgi:hypothetical protein